MRLRLDKLENRGFSLVEMMVTTLIIAVVIAGSYTIMSSGESAWFTTETNIQLSESLRQAVSRVGDELQETSTTQFTRFDNTGPGGSDIIQFAMPIVCEAGGSIINATGDVANWGAPLTWGCIDSTCMDADNDCSTRDYALVEYRLNSSNQLIRRVLDAGSTTVREDIEAHDITDFQVTIAANVVTMNITAQKTSSLNRPMTASRTADIYLRNEG